MATSDHDHVIRVWELTNLDPDKEPTAFRGHEGYIRALVFSPDGQGLATGGEDRIVRVWEVDSPVASPVVLRGITHDSSTGLGGDWAFRPDGSRLVTADHERVVRAWDLNSPLPSADPVVLRKFGESVVRLKISPDGRRVATVDGKIFWAGRGTRSEIAETVRVWDLDNPRAPAIELPGHSGGVDSTQFGPGGQTLAVVSGRAVRVYDLNASNPGADPLTIPVEKGGRLSGLALSHNGRRIVTDVGGSMDVWYPGATGRMPRSATLAGDHKNIYVMKFSPDGRWLVTVEMDEITPAESARRRFWRIWDLDSAGPLLHPVLLTQEGRSGTSVSFSPDGRWLAAGIDDIARLWEMSSSKTASSGSTLRGHAGDVYAVAFSPDGRRLATSGKDKTVRLWSTENPSEEPVVLRARSEVGALGFSPDNRWLVEGSLDLWDLRIDALIGLAGRTAGRDLTRPEREQYHVDQSP